jgi:hypothetical protein
MRSASNFSEPDDHVKQEVSVFFGFVLTVRICAWSQQAVTAVCRFRLAD